MRGDVPGIKWHNKENEKKKYSFFIVNDLSVSR
jgi:hypothetical protein